MSATPAQSSPPPLDYTSGAAAGMQPRRVETRETADGLTILIPPRPPWMLVLPRGLLLAGATAVLVFSVWRVSRHWSQQGLNMCTGIGLFLLCAVVVSALIGLIHAARGGGMQTVLQVSPTGLILDDPNHELERGRERRWSADEIGYVYVQRSALTAMSGFNLSVSVIRPGTGSMEHVCYLYVREPEFHRQLELVINRHLRSGPGSIPVMPLPAHGR